MGMLEQDRENKKLILINQVNHLVAIANEMGSQWSIIDACDASSVYPYISLTNGNITLGFKYGEWRKPERLIVNGEYENTKFFNYQEERPKITMDIKRDIKLLVKSIYKRIVPDAEALRIREIKQINKETEYKNKRNIAVNELKKYGVTEGRNENLILRDFSKSDVYCHDIRLTHDCKTISIELNSIPLEQFKKIMDIVKE